MDIVISERAGVRLLQFGTRWCQGAMRLARPDDLELEYAVRMNAWLLLHDPACVSGCHLATLGLGAGSLTRYAHGVLGLQATAVEIDGRVIDACRTHFLLPPDGAGLRTVLADGAAFVADPVNHGTIDVLQVDAYDAAVERPALDSEPFYADCRACLREGGSVAVNLFGRQLDLRAAVARLRDGMRPTAVWQFPPTEAGNVVVIAHTGPVPADEVLTLRAREVVRRWSLPGPSWLAMVRRWVAPG